MAQVEIRCCWEQDLLPHGISQARFGYYDDATSVKPLCKIVPSTRQSDNRR